ncbi:MAG: rubrerythrin, partial [Comamonadaceae bacterium]|nr:rubrerythrin [Comamonadaceae bacterium]
MEQLMAQALAMEREAVARYGELAEMMEVHNNREVAE